MWFFFLILESVFSQNLTTCAQSSGWLKTGRYPEVIELCQSFAKAHPQFVKCRDYGVSPEGRRLVYLHVKNFQLKKPLVSLWVQAGIHAGEVDGKDAGFWLLKDWLSDPTKRKVFSKVEMIFIPALSPDAHERFGAYNRPNQVGPQEMGWRVTSHNFNLNRDFLKTDAPEMRDLLKLWHQFTPHVSLDLHVTNGAQFKAQVGYVVSPTAHSGLSPQHLLGSKIEDQLIASMTKKSWLPLPFYPDLEDPQNPKLGFSRYVPGPRFSHGYWRLQGRIGVLVETHSWKDYATRVKIHRDTIATFLELIAQEESLKEVIEAYDSSKASFLPLSFKTTEKSREIIFPAFSYEVKTSPITSDKVVVYSKVEEDWKIPLYEELVVDKKIPLPDLGYYVPVQEAVWLKEKLILHKINFEVLKTGIERELLVFRASQTSFSPKPHEGRQTLSATGEWKRERVQLLKGSLFIPIKQKKAELIARMFEPEASDSFLSWGFFNRYFENKEYMEDYVLETVAQQMLRDPKLKALFEERLKEPAFRESKEQRFDFFYQRHPSWDQVFNRYPVLKL
jgi:hypothetical protein